ncbi:hypothetical protein N5C66_06390 [Rhizobium pusense]|uniref:hypothetical protein n=1 Tax=Agrobacterium pusense TaxID=648995 RepID=UPI0024491B4D|nr:hypothetical protein [Agrobacterium pusense]MDH1094719.1 hypothetical protein [Agrobacterium pusense]MDH1111356.1 hypothetical protein [Agrobacterium pusense]MDH2192699.1 hypothetical protein [Agrobacterium pusense]
MDENKVSVPLIAPAKINGVREPAGKTVTVSTTLALQLAASGAIPSDLAERLSDAIDMSDTPLEGDFQQAVETVAADRIEVLKVKHELEVAKLIEDHAAELKALTDQSADANAILTADLAAAVKRAETAEGDLVAEKAARAEAEAKLAEKATATPKPTATKK